MNLSLIHISMLAMENHSVSSVEGIIDDDVDKSIRNLTLIGRDGMNETDHPVSYTHLSGSTSSPRSMWARIGPHLPRQAG